MFATFLITAHRLLSLECFQLFYLKGPQTVLSNIAGASNSKIPGRQIPLLSDRPNQAFFSVPLVPYAHLLPLLSPSTSKVPYLHVHLSPLNHKASLGTGTLFH